MQIDQLNSPTEQVVESRNIIPIEEYFDDMYLTESEKEERKDLAKNLYVILSAILTIIKANEVLKNPHDTEYYKDYIASNLEILFDNVFGPGSYRSLIESFANEFVDSTMRHIDTPYFTSDDRAIVNAEQQSNAVYNQKQYEDAIASGKTHKTWVTMHDKRVRASHDAADGQEVEINKPFEIGSSELLFPGDLSLGANLKEICNCRCVVVYSGHKDTEDSLKEPRNDDKMKSPLIPMNLQFFGKETDLEKQSITSLQKGIKNHQKNIDLHIDKIKNPQNYCNDWDSKDIREQNGLIRHWNKEIRNSNDAIIRRIEELQKRGVDYGK